jgi:hypothetical protein
VLDVWFLERPFGEARHIENTVADTAIKYLTSVVAAAAAAATATATATVTKTATTEATSDGFGNVYVTRYRWVHLLLSNAWRALLVACQNELYPLETRYDHSDADVSRGANDCYSI